MASRPLSRQLCKVWFVYSLIGIVVSVAADQVIRTVLPPNPVSAPEIYSAVWFVIMGLALRKVAGTSNG
ncbi:hypothetical protein [Marinobacter xestospongiae]|uniref:Holin n=1 Tax=Marinobacter xestospongiae TaxID=994319 RepID=A0ABU3VV41_9GAMM|nr:hypothetical protein [Marinobacter xestospongiae]MDV2078148.1 hypothetical protein [Marinobacter xestospongiae]